MELYSSERLVSDETLCEAVVASILSETNKPQPSLEPTSPFSHLIGARFNHFLQKTVNLVYQGKSLSAFVTSQGGNSFTVKIGDK